MLRSLLHSGRGASRRTCQGAPLGQLDRTLIESYGGWSDAFAPHCKAAECLEALCWEMGRAFASDPPGPFCREEFIAHTNWQRARELARAALKEGSLQAWPLPSKINFSDYIEILEPEEARSGRTGSAAA